ncbi:hypothetical protein BGZ94_000599 [Podila epigama]|nr:hypothetical protein BGZ94_000599 [Podila epigama]
MPAFTQISSASVVGETALTCTCDFLGPEFQDGMFIYINGMMQHSSTCALSLSTAHSSTGRCGKQHREHQKKLCLCCGKLKRHQGQGFGDDVDDNNSSDCYYDEDEDEDMSDMDGTALRKPPPSMLKRTPFDSVRMLPKTSFHLFPGSKFKGKQKSGSSCYDVMVDIKDINLNDSILCGYLHINGLTEEYPELTTFFEAEIVGPDYAFVTRKWDADVKTDKEHWSLFQPFQPFADTFDKEQVEYDASDPENTVVYMRWKEHFLVPDHRVEGIAGASFAGFYYICYHKLTGTIEGYYYHRTSEKFQKLTLSHVQERPSFGSYEFR